MPGEARDRAAELAEEARRVQTALRPGDAPVCLLAGGETTVTIRGRGKGGRHQEMALAATLALANDCGIDLACVGTDGTDGPTDAAGGYAFGGDLARLRALGLRPQERLDANDSYPLLLGGYFAYGAFVEKVFGADFGRPTPVKSKHDGVDYMELPRYKIFLIQLLNIAGLGPVIGPILGALYGPSALLWVVFGCILKYPAALSM